jgi:uncharacterized membrane protein YfcA
MTVTSEETSKASLKPWWLLTGIVLVLWAIVVVGYGYWPLVRAHWSMALVMILGSLVAGSTPMGGGSVSFPILVYAFGELPENARSFGLAIQALGMTSALVFIFCRRVPVQTRLLICSCAGAAAGMVLGTFFVGPYASRALVKLLFSCLWMSFAILTLARNREFCSLTGKPVLKWSLALKAGLPLGLAGGLIASLIGVGLEMVIYTVLVLVFRCDLKIAVPTAVCATAVTSVIGILLHLGIGDVPRAVFGEWLAAAPVVIFGAPIGAYLVGVISRMKVLYFVSALCVFQFAWTLREVTLRAAELLFVVGSLAGAGILFYLLYKLGLAKKSSDASGGAPAAVALMASKAESAGR